MAGCVDSKSDILKRRERVNHVNLVPRVKRKMKSTSGTTEAHRSGGKADRVLDTNCVVHSSKQLKVLRYLESCSAICQHTHVHAYASVMAYRHTIPLRYLLALSFHPDVSAWHSSVRDIQACHYDQFLVPAGDVRMLISTTTPSDTDLSLLIYRPW